MLFRLVALALVCLWLCPIDRSYGAKPQNVPLPPPQKWAVQDATVTAIDGVARVSAPVNYKIGRATSPTSPARSGESFTAAAEISTYYRVTQGEYYECWLELEFLAGEKSLSTASSPRLVGSRSEPRLIAVTAVAPERADGVRASICVQNKRWDAVANHANVSGLRLLKLDEGEGEALELEVAAPFARGGDDRSAEVVVRGTWPDGTAVRIESRRGAAPASVLIEHGEAHVRIDYAAFDVGATEVTATVFDQSASIELADPKAATLTLNRAEADGYDTPVRVRLTREGEMLPGRYQEATPGIFATPPWSIELAPGKWNLRISKGPQFRSIERSLTAESGETLDLGEIELERIVDLPKSGWYGGDADGDVYHGELIYQDIDADTALEISHAMGLDWVGVGRWGVRDLGGPHLKTWGEASDFMESRGRDGFLFVWTDERPKSGAGHACFVGLARPDSDRFEWGWTNLQTPLRNFQELQMIRASGAATFANHPLRWWMNSGRFRTNMYSTLPFDLCAAGLLDGVNVNDKPENLELWSMLLDHGYRVSATAGADFALDRPAGPLPGHHRMYCFCPEGLSSEALAQAIRAGQTIVSTGPTLVANLDGKPPGTMTKTGRTYRIDAAAWARGDEDDPLRRLELWSHGKVVEAKVFDKGAASAEATFEWKPQGDWDWVAVRATSLKGFAITSAFYAKSDDHDLPAPVRCDLTLDVQGVAAKDLAGAEVQIWDGAPGITGSQIVDTVPLKEARKLEAPASATIVVRLADGRQRQTTVFEASGAEEALQAIAAGDRRQEPLLEWKTYEDVLERCRKATATLNF